jgi:L-lysine exporter family protein LysE/ArgO
MLLQTYFTGALLAGGLIVAVGPQNLHVMRSGLARRHLGATVALCVAADALLIGLGLAGASAALLASPTWAEGVRWVGVPALAWLAWRAAREAMLGAAAPLEAGPAATPVRPATLPVALGEASAVTFGNPVVWIETLLIVGAAGATLPGPERAAFGVGALSASAAWFCGLGYGARAAARWLAHPAVYRVLAACSALALAGMACQLSGARVVVSEAMAANQSSPSARPGRGVATTGAPRAAGSSLPTSLFNEGILS